MTKRAIVYWAGNGHCWIETPFKDARPVGPYSGNESLDAAIRGAHAAGFNIAGVQATRGLIPDVAPRAPEGIDGNRSA